MATTGQKRPGERADDCKRDMRCLCGSLIARLVDGGVEIKCRRCQRIVKLPLEAGPTTERAPP